MDFKQFREKYTGKETDWDGKYGSQCVDLYRMYCNEVLDIPQSPPVTGASDIWSTYLEDHFERIPNTPDGVPQYGDIIIWNRRLGNGYGHVAIYVRGDVNSFVSFDTNWPVGSLAHEQNHSYSSVQGWLRFKGELSMPQEGYVEVESKKFEELVTKSSRWDEVLKLGYKSAASVKQEHDSLIAEIKSLKEQLQSERERADAHKTEFTALQAKAAKALGTVQELNEVYNALDRVSTDLDRLEDLERNYAALQLSNAEEKEALTAEVAKWKAVAENTAKLGDYDTSILIKEIIRRIINAMNLGR